jgi:putative DNA primase/helicase
MARRTVRIRLDAKSEEPWRRTGFRHADIRASAQAHRGRLIAAALTLGQGWLDAGRPGGVATLGMFESWARVLGGVLTVAGVDGFLGNLGEFYQDADLEGAEIRDFLAAWWTAHAEGRVTAADLVTLDALPGRVAEAGKGRDDRGRPRRLGNLLSGLRDRIYRLPDGLTVRVEKAGEAQHLARWRLKAIGGGR